MNRGAFALVLLVAASLSPASAQSVDPAIPAPVTLHYAYRNADGSQAGAFAVAVTRTNAGYVFEEAAAQRTHSFDRNMVPIAFRRGGIEMVRNARGYDVTTPKKRALLEAGEDARIFYSIFFMLMGYDFTARKALEFTPVDYRALDLPAWKRAIALPRLRVTYVGTESNAHHLRLQGAAVLGSAFPACDLWYASAAPHYLLRTKPGSAREQAITLERVD